MFVLSCGLKCYSQKPTLSYGNNLSICYRRRDKDSVIWIYNGILFSLKTTAICVNKNEPRGYCLEEDKYCIISVVCGI